MQSGGSQETFVLCAVKTRVPLYTFPKGKNMRISFPLCLHFSSIHTGKHMIIIVGLVDTLMAIFTLIIFK